MAQAQVNYRDTVQITVQLGSATRDSVAYLRDEICQAIVAAVRDYQDGMREISDNPRLSNDARQSDWADLRERVTSEIDSLETKGKDAIERIRAAISKATQEPQDVASQTLRQLQIQNGWQRAQLMLAGGADLTQIAREAGASGDADLIAALKVNAPAYLASIHAPRSLAESVMKALDSMETPGMSEKERVCRDLSGELSQGGAQLSGCAGYARMTIAGKWDVGILPAWRNGQSLQVAPAIPGTR